MRLNTSLPFLVLALCLVVATACAQERSPEECKLEPLPTREPGSAPSNVPPGMPYIFEGNYFVDGEPGPGGQRIFTKLTTSRSQVGTTLDGGRYLNIIHGPVSDSDWDVPFIFCLGDPEGLAVPAKETYDYENLGQPHAVELDLHFPRFPDE